MLNGSIYSNGNRNLDIVHIDKNLVCLFCWGGGIVGNVEKTSLTQPQLASHGQ